MIFIRDTEKREKVKCIQADSATSKEWRVISEKNFMVEDFSIEDYGTKSDSDKEEDSEDKFDVKFWEVFSMTLKDWQLK